MAQVIERSEPVIVNEREDRVIEDRRSNTGPIVAVVLLLILLMLLFGGSRLFGGSESGSTNVNTPAPSTSVEQ